MPNATLETDINNEVVKTHAEAAKQAYELYDVNINQNIKINGQEYKVLLATPNTTKDGFQCVVCRLGFNPTKNREYKTKLKTAA